MAERWTEARFKETFPLKPVEWPISGVNDEGGIDCYKATELLGVLIGDATVHAGASLIVRGVVVGNVAIESGAVAHIRGMVTGNVTVQGAVAIYGVVCGAFSEEGNSVAYVAPRTLHPD